MCGHALSEHAPACSPANPPDSQVCLLSVLTSILFFALPLGGRCRACTSTDPEHCVSGRAAFRTFTGYRCGEGRYNDLAVLVFNPQVCAHTRAHVIDAPGAAVAPPARLAASTECAQLLRSVRGGSSLRGVAGVPLRLPAAAHGATLRPAFMEASKPPTSAPGLPLPLRATSSKRCLWRPAAPSRCLRSWPTPPYTTSWRRSPTAPSFPAACLR
jgi:hypothetical protein